ncbi:MAG: S8 family peptidase [Ignavibacteria bacterium]|nr:S8 family peptidase [Ignavibacteria bacterium]
MGKKYRLLFVIPCVVLFVVLTSTSLLARWPQVAETSVIHDGPVPMVAGFINVRFTSANTLVAAQAVLPDGYIVESCFLDSTHALNGDGKGQVLQSSVSKDLQWAVNRLSRTFIVRYTAPLHPLSAASQLLKVDGIEIAEPWYAAEMHATPNDPLWPAQVGVRRMKFDAAWDITQGNPNVVIAISDNGVTQDHEDIKPSLWTNVNEVPGNMLDDDGNGYVDDYTGVNFSWSVDGTSPGSTTNHSNGGHGTKVAGLAGAATNNGLGIAGSSNGSRLFPMKTASANGGNIVYGYQSLIYAADMGFKVANCSWGIVKPPSPIDQSVIDYCLAKNLVVVASAGNQGSAPNSSGWTDLNFPAAYDGVIGVGEVSATDILASSSGLGKNAVVMASSTDAITTGSGGNYTSDGIVGTSFSAPMASGAIALIRTRYPQLSPRQVAALLRRTADDITQENPSVAHIISGRLNAYRAVTTDPTTLPALRIQNVQRTFTNGKAADRFAEGDTLDFTYTIVNDLALINNVNCELKIADASGWDVTILQNTRSIASIDQGQTQSVGTFRVRVNTFSPLPCIFRLTYTAVNYSDSSLDYLMQPSGMATMENNQLVYSVGDDGTFGYNNSLVTRQGVGFGWKKGYNLISPSGFLFCENKTRVLKGFDNINNRSEFSPQKPYTEPQRNRSVMTDSTAAFSRQVGIRVEQTNTFPSSNSQSTVLSITIENRSGLNLTDIAAGDFFDWDIGSGGQENITRLASDAIPETFRYIGDAQAFQRNNVAAVIVCAAVSDEIDIQAQVSGFLLADKVGAGITDTEVIELLNSGTAIQTTATGDVSGVIGMKFRGTLLPGERRSFRIIIGVASTYDEATEIVRNAILTTSVVEQGGNANVQAFPIPASDVLTVRHRQGVKSIELFDFSGRRNANLEVLPDASESYIDVSNLYPGVYQCRIGEGSSYTVIPIIVIH